MSYTRREHYDRDYRSQIDSGWASKRSDRWTHAFIRALRAIDAQRILDLGCGLGYEALTLTKEGFDVTGLDLSAEAAAYAQSMVGPDARFVVADMAERLPFPDCYFDAVMSNVAVHMFSDSTTRAVFSEVKRILRPSGLFLFHVGALEERTLRGEKEVCEIEPNYVLFEPIGPRHFFSRDYLLELLSDWQNVHLESVEILYSESEERFEHVVIDSDEGKEHRASLLAAGFVTRRRLWRGIICR